MAICAVARISNHRSLCVGQITTKEAEGATDSDFPVDGFGTYLVLADDRDPMAPGTVLAKFASEHAAQLFANFLRVTGHLEPA